MSADMSKGRKTVPIRPSALIQINAPRFQSGNRHVLQLKLGRLFSSCAGPQGTQIRQGPNLQFFHHFLTGSGLARRLEFNGEARDRITFAVGGGLPPRHRPRLRRLLTRPQHRPRRSSCVSPATVARRVSGR